MYNVYQHWDPLKVCAVGRSYPPEFYSWITVPHVRELFERIATETEEDYQAIINKLQEFGVEIVRPNLPKNTIIDGKHVVPPMCPRDFMIMIDNQFCSTVLTWDDFYQQVRDPSWPEHVNDISELEIWQQQECNNLHNWQNVYDSWIYTWKPIVDKVQSQGNAIKHLSKYKHVNGACVSRIGRDLYFGTENYSDDPSYYQNIADQEFPHKRNHIVNTGGHSDGTYCPVCPGLIISLEDVPTYAKTFPGWEVVYLPGQSWDKVQSFLALKYKNRGKWWIPGFETDQSVIDVVENWLGHWTGYVEETVFDVNMLIIDPKNVMVFNYNEQVFTALERYGITPHIVPFRHRYFWDGGIHCVTLDLHREGVENNYFPERK